MGANFKNSEFTSLELIGMLLARGKGNDSELHEGQVRQGGEILKAQQ